MPSTPHPQLLLEAITPRQMEVLQLITRGKSTKEIAYMLKISIKTVESHRMNLTTRLKIYDIPGLVRFALKTGLIHWD